MDWRRVLAICSHPTVTDNPPLERTAAAVYFTCHRGSRAPPRPLNGITLSRKMNVFELGIIAAPITGLIAGTSAANGQTTGVVLACALGGAVIGGAAYFGTVLASGFIWSRVRDPEAPPERPGAIEWTAGTAVVLLAALSPVMAWWLVRLIVPRLLGVAG